MLDLSNSTPLTGRWLVDSSLPFASVPFNIIRMEEFPIRELQQSDLLARLIENFLNIRTHQLSSYGGNLTSNVPDDDALSLNALFKIVSALRLSVANLTVTRGNMVLPSPFIRVENNAQLPAEVLKSRMLALRLARLAVFGGVNVYSLAKQFGVNADNVKIWVYSFLAYGQQAFFQRHKALGKYRESRIVSDHFKHHSSIPLTCARYLLWNRNHLKRMISRHHP